MSKSSKDLKIDQHQLMPAEGFGGASESLMRTTDQITGQLSSKTSLNLSSAGGTIRNPKDFYIRVTEKTVDMMQ